MEVSELRLQKKSSRTDPSGHQSVLDVGPEAREPCSLRPKLMASSRDSTLSPLALLTNTEGGCVDAISNLSAAALFLPREEVFLLVLVWGAGTGNAGMALCEDVEASAVEDEDPSLARATGISSRDSAESEWYSAGGAAAWTEPELRTSGGKDARRGNAGRGSR
ncbi:hypothetical protein LDENG_00277700 [Lucifuga dentata]|nr:hypothetical protein LDENG_00277700 [Lucifuga dentata]